MRNAIRAQKKFKNEEITTQNKQQNTKKKLQYVCEGFRYSLQNCWDAVSVLQKNWNYNHEIAVAFQ